MLDIRCRSCNVSGTHNELGLRIWIDTPSQLGGKQIKHGDTVSLCSLCADAFDAWMRKLTSDELVVAEVHML